MAIKITHKRIVKEDKTKEIEESEKDVIELHCLRCGHNWEPLIENPSTCPACKSYKWDKERIRR